MQVTLEQKKIFEVKSESGTIFKMSQVDEWNGMLKLETVDGDTLIVMGTESVLGQTLNQLFDKPNAFQVVQGSPFLLKALAG